MTRPSDSLDDLGGDLHHLSTLVTTITNFAIDAVDPDKTAEAYKADMVVIGDLLWIARDMVSQIADNGDAVHRKVLADRNAARKAVAS